MRIGMGIFLGNQGTPWSPLFLGGSVSRWWKDNMSVSTWVDEKGNSNMTQATGANQPTVSAFPSGAPALNFAGDPHRMAASFVATYGSPGALTVWSIVKLSAFTTVSGQGAVLPGNNYFGTTGLYWGADITANSGKLMWAGKLAGTAGKFALSNASIADNLVHRVIGTWDGTTYKLYVDGTLQTTQGADNAAVVGGDTTMYCAEGSSSVFGATTGLIGDSGVMIGTAISGSISNVGDNLWQLDQYLKRKLGQ